MGRRDVSCICIHIYIYVYMYMYICIQMYAPCHKSLSCFICMVYIYMCLYLHCHRDVSYHIWIVWVYLYIHTSIIIGLYHVTHEWSFRKWIQYAVAALPESTHLSRRKSPFPLFLAMAALCKLSQSTGLSRRKEPYFVGLFCRKSLCERNLAILGAYKFLPPHRHETRSNTRSLLQKSPTKDRALLQKRLSNLGSLQVIATP